MASGDTREQNYLDIAAHGRRADLPSETCCETRTQTLTREVAERIITEEETRAAADRVLQGEIDEIKNNPDVADIVPTYAALQDYDTSTLTDKDIIRVLADETHGGASTYYRWSTSTRTFTYVGESGDYYTKGQINALLDEKQDELTAGEGITIEDESGALVISATGGGGGSSIIELTSADYNYPTNNPDGINPLLLSSGFYKVTKSMQAYINKNQYREPIKSTVYGDMYFVVDRNATAGSTRVIVFYPVGADLTDTNGEETIRVIIGNTIGTLILNEHSVLMSQSVKDNLTSTDTLYPLSANQGKVLKGLIDGLAISGAGAPITSTVGTVGKLYEDTTNGKLYICTAVSGGTYTWEEVGGGSSDTGKAKVLTADDYNWPTSNPDGVAIWLLDSGTYICEGNSNVKVYRNSTSSYTGASGIYLVDSSNRNASMYLYFAQNSDPKWYTVKTSNGQLLSTLLIPQVSQYSGTSTYEVMSQKAVTDMVDGRVKQNAGAPTTSTVGTVGQLLEDTTNGDLYICTDATNPYVWEEVGAGGGGPTVVQTTGTSTTDVMSQNAVTESLATKQDATTISNNTLYL